MLFFCLFKILLIFLHRYYGHHVSVPLIKSQAVLIYFYFFLISRPVISYIKTNPAPSIFSMNDYSKQDMTYIVKAKYCLCFTHVISKVKRNIRTRWVLHLQAV